MRNPPAEVIATWPAPNYVNPESRGDALLIVESTVASVAVVTVLARLYVRMVKVSKSGLDDWLMLAAMIFGIGVTVCVILSAQLYGWNIHIWDLKASQGVKGRQVSLAAQTLFLFASGLAKDSILVSYLRIAPQNSMFRRLTYGSIVLVTSLIFIFLIVLWTQCIPMQSYWTSDGHKDCHAEGPPVLSQAITTVATDLLVCALPLPTLMKLKLPIAQRIALIVLFSLGIVVVFAASMRAYWSHYVTDETYDVTWEGFYLWIWTAVEANLGVICGSIPALRPLFRTMFRSKASRYYNESTNARSAAAATRPRGMSNQKPNRSWADTLQRSSKGIKIMDDHIDVERGTYEVRCPKDDDSPVSTLEMDTWPPPRHHRLPDHSPGPLHY